MPPKKKTAFAPKDMVLAKMTGFPAWPSFVMPAEMIPGPIMKAKKKTTNMCVIFIPDGDFNWMNEKSLEALTPEKLNSKISKIPKDKLKPKAKKKTGRTNNVVEALVAANNLDFDDFMEELNKNTESDEENEEAVEEEANDEEDEIEEDIEDEGHVKRTRDSGNGRNRIDDSVDESIELIDEEDSDRKRRTRAEKLPEPKRAKNGKEKAEILAKNGDLKEKNGEKDKKTAESPRSMSEKDRQHQLWLCRIKLQRSLIQRNQPITPKDPKSFPAPTVDELLVARIILHRLADFPVNVELLRETKIHKVLRCILKDEDLEYPDSFRLHEKCEELLEKWHDLIESLKQEKSRSRVGSLAPEDSEVSALDVKKDYEKVEV